MGIKTFQLPSFEEWKSKNYDYTGKLGVFYCSVERFCYYSDGICFKLSVANFEIPSNINVNQIISISYMHVPSEPDAMAKLEAWYNGLQEALNKKWFEYIEHTYLN